MIYTVVKSIVAGGGWCVRRSDGSIIATHSTHREALEDATTHNACENARLEEIHLESQWKVYNDREI